MKKIYFLSFFVSFLLYSEEIPDFRMRRVEAGQYYKMRIGTVKEPEKRMVFYKVVISKPYKLSATEVTVGQWKAVMGGESPYQFSKGDDYPVTNVSYNDIQEFLKKLNRNSSGKPYRLPTYAEWELAAKGPANSEKEQKIFYWGNNPALGNDYEWNTDNYGNESHKVGTRKPNPNGIYDLWGNAGEWLSDGRINASTRELRLGNKGDGICLLENDPDYCYPADHTVTDPAGDAGADRFCIIEFCEASILKEVGTTDEYYKAFRREYKTGRLGFRLAQDAD